MYPTHPDVFLLVQRQELAQHVRDGERRRIAAARRRLERDEERLQRAFVELTAALADRSESRRRVEELVGR